MSFSPDIRATADLAPLDQSQLHERIASRLHEWIREGRFAEGERLPSERELALRLGVSRSSVREAIGVLQVDGLVETRPGSGTFVVADAGATAASVAPSIGDASPFAVLQAREALEPSIVRTAAERRLPSERAEVLLETMKSALDPHDPAARIAWSDADRDFHRELAVMSGNSVYTLLADEVAKLMDQPLWRRLRDDLIAEPGRTEAQLADHLLIYRGIVEGEPEAAATQAMHHVQRVRRHMRD